MPVVIYVDKAGEKVIIGNLFMKGENVTTKEAGPPKPRKIDMGILEMEKSPSLGNKGAKVTIVEFSNFQCPYCMDSWIKLIELIKRVSKRYPICLQTFPISAAGKDL